MEAKVFVGFLILAKMLFHAMPCNDPCDPGSEMSPMHPDNVRLRVALADVLGGVHRVRVEWFDIWPFAVSFMAAMLSTVVIIFMMG